MAPEVKMANPSRITNFLSSLVPAPIKRGFNTGVDVMTAAAQAAKEKGVGQGYSVFSSEYPQALAQQGVTIREKPTEFLGAYAARLLTDVGTDSSRHVYWRYNHPMALADAVVEKVAGKAYTDLDPTQKATIGLAVGVPVAASLGTFDLTNPGELFRPKGYAQSYAEVGSEDRRQTDQPGLEVIERMVLGRQGRPLKYETAKQDIPNLTPESYGRVMQDYYQDKGVGGLGLLKFTGENIQGVPEARIVGFPVGLQAAGALAGGATAMRQALKNPARSTAAKAGITLAGSLAGGLVGNAINQVIAKANRPTLPTVAEYEQSM